ncbi:protein eva-1 homolog C isoform X2 [Protopterus annectens]|uniref:protein eva-1 homolog C isoform X2 n=1 Tax=Protopterus annectens TaxID=7888 RepID=UPI001CF9AE36|nr:protein eva-1 homolog C isoform X2 [Protopterus annectens]
MPELDGCHNNRNIFPVFILCGMYFVLIFCTKELSGLSFSGYLTRLLQNHTDHACDGDHITLQCPRHSTISIQSAFYGSGAYSFERCPKQQLGIVGKESWNCLADTTLQKVTDECQNQRACQLLVNSHLFGPDPCPDLTKYLLVSYKCKPTEYKTKMACEGTEFKLRCKESRLIVIYSATYGSSMQDEAICTSLSSRMPQFDCFSYAALDIISKACSRKQSCQVMVNSSQFRSPCLPGIQKYLNVSYSCVPEVLLKEVDRALNSSTPEPDLWEDDDVDIKVDPKGSQLLEKEDMIVTSILATYAYIKDHQEKAALVFISGVCIGLAFTVCALVIHMSCKGDIRKLRQKKEPLTPESDNKNSETESGTDESSASDFSDEMTGLYRISYSVYDLAEAADMAERIERREQIMQEIWMNGGPDTSVLQTMNHYY